MATVLLLGGTGDARRLAIDLVAAGHMVTASLAGATAAPAPYPCPTRIGGFGGVAGLAAYLRHHRPDALIDATHPYAAQISRNACAAARDTGVPLLRLSRPVWTRQPPEVWTEVPDMAAAAAALPTGARAFLATGRQSLSAFLTRTDIWIALRQVDPPAAAFPGTGQYVLARPPFDEAAERALFTDLRITHLVAKNAGGEAARTKLTAAAALHIPITMVARPDGAAAEGHSAEAILACLAAL